MSDTEEQLQTQSNVNELQTDIGIWQQRLRQAHQEQSEAEECGNKALAAQKAREEQTAVDMLRGQISLLKEELGRLSEFERKEIEGELLKTLTGYGLCKVVGLGVGQLAGRALGGALGAGAGGPPGAEVGAFAGGELADAATDVICDEVAESS
jgi:hypothetical protein